MTTPLDDIRKEFFRALRPPARTARGRAAALVRARVALVRARTRLIYARMGMTRAQARVARAKVVVARARRRVAQARADVKGYATPTNNQEATQ